MIPGDPETMAVQPSQDQRGVSVDDIFRRIARRRPDTLAVADPPNRETFTSGAPHRLSYVQAARVVEAVAARLRDMGLPTDAIVGIQMPNVVENILTILGVMRAGMIAAPLPLLWRRTDAVAALARIGAKALICCGHTGSFNHCQFALRVAAEVFSIRYVCGFGKNLPDGVVSFDDLITARTPDLAPPLDRESNGNSAARVAAISFDVGAGGVVPVARTHLELLAAGLAVLIESGLAQDSVILSTVAPASFAGICLTLVPWILSAGTLLLHHPFNSNILGRQWRDDRFGALVLPGPVAFRLADTGVFAREGPTCIVAPWRSPDLLATSPVWAAQNINLVDVAIFGETGLVAVRRDGAGRPAPLPLGPLAAPAAGTGAAVGAVVVAELALTEAGTVGMRGPMVPHHMFPPGIERSGLPHFKIGHGGLVDSGYPCSVDLATQALVVTGPPAGIVSIGGYRFPLHDLQEVVGRVDSGATLAAVPDPLVGQRLIGAAADRATVQAALNAVGFNPLVVAAFGDRGEARVHV
jgi:hypothetical protein